MVGPIWDRAVGESLGVRRQQLLAITLAEVSQALEGNPRRDDILEGFHDRGTIRPGQDGGWLSVAAAGPVS